MIIKNLYCDVLRKALDERYFRRLQLPLRAGVIVLISVVCLCGCAGEVTDIELSEGDLYVEQVVSSYIADEKTDGNEDSETDILNTGADLLTVEAEEHSMQCIYVYICGAVVNPGVYIVPENSRAEYVLELAGGFADGANTVYVNLAAKLGDGKRVFIPYLDEEKNYSMDEELNNGTETLTTTYPVNINTANVSQLCTIPGIGETRAKAIIEYRNNYGPFERIEDIMKVSGIGEASFSKMSSHICVN